MDLESNLTIVEGVDKPKFTTLDRVKAELGIMDRSRDDVISQKICEASSDVQLALGFAVASETVSEAFRAPRRWLGLFQHRGLDKIFLRRRAVSEVISVTLDDVVVDPSQYELNADEGSLLYLDASGYACGWQFCKSLIVEHIAGYVLPGTSGANLPPTIEGITVDMVKSFWFSRNRDPLLKAENLPGVRDAQYWVGEVGDPSLLPPEIQRRISLIRRPRMAVA